jgi:hypothetical protein
MASRVRQQIDGGSFPAEVSALETDAQAMAHLIEEFGRPRTG